MSKKPLFLCAIMILMVLQPAIANSVAPNDSIESNGQTSTLSIDGYVSTKFSSVGDTVDIFALTRGHSMSNSGSTNTIVTADILHYPDNDPIGVITQGEIPSAPVVIDTVVMQPIGAHDNDSSTLVWEGEYVIPINALGGVYGASITAEEGVLRATDNPTQIPELLIDEIEKVLTAIDTTWDTANPTMEIKAVFDNLNSSGADAGGWVNWVNQASRQPGIGESGQLWSNMINAGYNNYELDDGAKFLESLMQFLESSDLDAGMAFLTGLMTYGNEFPLPQTVNDFQAVADYLGSFDPIENFTRFSGTDNFSAAYDAMLGSNEWASLEVALDNLANNTKVFESFQTVLQNIALLSVSIHPEALIDGVEAWIAPLRDGDFENMTPFQKLVSSWADMEVTFQDLDGDDVPDEIVWEYELLLNTTEGLQWQAKMDTTYPYISEGFDDFNSFDVEIIDILISTTEDPAWNIASDAIAEFSSWARNFSLDIEVDWEYDYESSEDDDSGDDGGSEDSDDTNQWQDVFFDDLHPIQNSIYDKHVLDLGFEFYFDLGGQYDWSEDYPNSFNITLTNSEGIETIIELTRNNQWDRQYVARHIAPTLELDTLAFSQPMESYNPPCRDSGDCFVERAELRIQQLRPSLLETMPVEVIDEIFLVSAIGVLVDQDETVQVGQPLTINSTTYDAVTGAISGADVDTAVLRISPGLAESAVSTLSPDGELTLTNSNPSTLSASYSSSDIDGVFTIEIESRGEAEGEDMSEDQYSFQGYISEESNDGYGWDLSAAISALPYDQRGVATVTSEATTYSGLNIQITDEIVLPSSPGCTISKAVQESDFNARIGWKYGHFNFDGVQFDRTSLESIDVDWGDGITETFEDNDATSGEMDYWTNSHTYSQTDGIDEYTITIDYNFEHNVVRNQQFVFKEYQGIENGDDDGNTWYDGYVESNEEWRYCQLSSRSETYTPGPSIINEFITDGPFEVMAQQISTSGSLGEASLTVIPPHTGVYISIVQSEITRSSDGETLTGIGLNIGAATQGAISLSGMDVIDHFAGLPVYAANVSESGLKTVNIDSTGLIGQKHKVTVALTPLDLSIPFPDAPSEIWSEAETNELQFTETDDTRSQELRFEAPLSLIAATSFATSDDGEVENQLSPLALHIGLVLTNPEELDITGTLGPGQTTNIALDADLEQATRMLAVASPSQGFDTATIDFSTISELIWDEGVRNEMGWINAEEKMQTYCEEIDAWSYSSEDGTYPTEVQIRVVHQSEIHPYVSSLSPSPDVTNMQLKDSNGNIIQALSTTSGASDTETTLIYDSSNWGEGESFTFETNTEYSSTLEFEMGWDDDGEYRPIETNEKTVCDGDYDLTDGEIFDIFDDYVGRLSSIAWGQGSSADLELPYLSSPISEYTVIGVAQRGSGSESTLVSAVSTTLSETNPEPPELQNLSLVFTPQNPSPGDIVLVTITDEDINPVEGLSITLVRENQTLSSLLSDENGQGSFAIPLGTIVVRVSGGQYYPVEFTIVVTEEGIDDGSLPGDMDGDGVGDLLDAFPNDPSEWSDTDGDNIGNNADTDDDSDGLLDADEISSEPQTNPLEADTDGDGYCDGLIPVQSICIEGDAFPTDSSEWKDSDGDGIGDNSDPTPFGDVDNPTNQTGDQSNNTNQTSGTDSTDQGDESSDSTSGNMLVIGGSIAAVLFIIIIGVIMFIRGRSDSESNKWLESDDSLFDDPGPTSSPPGKPPVTERGEMIDGYEAIEYPPGTGLWFYRDPTSGQWIEWR